MLRQLEERQPLLLRPRQLHDEMDTFEQQEMSKSRPQVKNKLRDIYGWLVNHIPELNKDKASRVFKTFKDKVMGLYKRFKGEKEEQNEESFNPAELKQVFSRAYRSYGINGRSRMDVETFFEWIRQNLIDLMNRELTDLGSARVQTTAWIRLRKEVEDESRNIIGVDKERLAFNSRMVEIFQGSDLNEIVNEMFTHMKTETENPTLRDSGFRFDEVLFLDVNFHQLNLTRGSSYLSLLDWIGKKKAIINPIRMRTTENVLNGPLL